MGVVTAQYAFQEKVWVDYAGRMHIKTPYLVKGPNGLKAWYCPPEVFDESMMVTHWMPLPEPPNEDEVRTELLKRRERGPEVYSKDIGNGT